VDRLIAAAERGGAPCPTRCAFNRRFAPLVRELRRRIEEAGPLQHLHYEMTRVERRDPDFSTTAIHGLDAVRYLAGCDYAGARFRYRELPGLGPGVAEHPRDAVMASGATAHLAFCPVAGVLVERATAHAHGHTLLLHVPMWSGVDSAGPALALRGGTLTADLGGDRVGDGTALFEAGGFYRETGRLPRRARRGPGAVAEPPRVAPSRWRSRSGSGTAPWSTGPDGRAVAETERRMKRVPFRRGDGRGPPWWRSPSGRNSVHRSARLDAWKVIGPGGGRDHAPPGPQPARPQGRPARVRHDGRLRHRRRRGLVADDQLRVGADRVRL